MCGSSLCDVLFAGALLRLAKPAEVGTPSFVALDARESSESLARLRIPGCFFFDLFLVGDVHGLFGEEEADAGRQGARADDQRSRKAIALLM